MLMAWRPGKVVLVGLAAALCLVSFGEAASPVPAPSAFLRRQASLTRFGKLNLYGKGGDDNDNHNDPDAYVPQGKGKEETKSLSSLSMHRLSLRGGSAAAPDAKSGEPKLQIVFVSAEIAPWSVTGGLGAVCKHCHFLFSFVFRDQSEYTAIRLRRPGVRWIASCDGQGWTPRYVYRSSVRPVL